MNQNFSAVSSVVNGQLDHNNLSAGAGILISQLSLTSSALDIVGAGNLAWGAGQSGDSVARVGLFSDSSIQFGPGSATATDVGINRSGANTLTLYDPASASTPCYLTGVNLNTIPVNGGRIYGTTGQPFADADDSLTLYFGPAYSNTITLENATSLQLVTQTFSQASASVTGLTSATMYDVYVNSASSTTVAISFVAWSGVNTPPTRGTDILGRATANGAVNKLLVGSIYAVSDGVNVACWDRVLKATVIGTVGSGARLIHNVYNRIPKSCCSIGSNNTGGTFATFTAVANPDVQYCLSFADESPIGTEVCYASAANLNAIVYFGISLNAANSPMDSGNAYTAFQNTLGGQPVTMMASCVIPPAAGLTNIRSTLQTSAGTGNWNLIHGIVTGLEM